MVECYLALDCKAKGRGREHDLNFIRVPASHLEAAAEAGKKATSIGTKDQGSSYILHKTTVNIDMDYAGEFTPRSDSDIRIGSRSSCARTSSPPSQSTDTALARILP